MTRVLYDTNVVLDVLLKREPFLALSTAALNAAAEQVEGFIAAHAVTTVAYMLQRSLGAQETRSTVARLLSRLKVAAVADSTIRSALLAGTADFEDAVCYAAGQEAAIDVIVTRDPAGFAVSTIPALAPEAFLATL